MEAQVCRETGAFNPEYPKLKPAEAIKTDLYSYLGEYRFGISEFKYNYIYYGGHLHDIYERTPWVIRTRKAIEKQLALGKNPSREIAEHEGIKRLNFFIKSAHEGDSVLWVSPPGTREEGYGPYGYIFKGLIDREIGSEKHITMSALRVNSSDIPTYNNLLTDIVGTRFHYGRPEEFLENPMVLSSFQLEPENAIILHTGNQKKTDKEFRFAMNILNPLITEFIKNAHSNIPRSELRKIFYSIEKLALQIKENVLEIPIYSLVNQIMVNPQSLIDYYGSSRAPVALGSCGSTNDKSTNILNEDNFVKQLLDGDEDEFGSLTFKCDVCGGEHTRPPHVILTICPTKQIEMQKCQ